MDLPIIDNTSAYIDVCNKAGLPINKMPKKGDDIPLAYEMAMKEFNPYLYQNLVQPDPTELPADVLDRHNRQAYWTTDVEALEAKGFTGTAANLRKQMEEGRRQIEEQKLQEMIGTVADGGIGPNTLKTLDEYIQHHGLEQTIKSYKNIITTSMKINKFK